MEKQRRIAEYFVIAGLPENPIPLDEDGSSAGSAQDGLSKSLSGRVEPITDICVIFPSENELCPPGYKLLGLTPGGLPADLNHGSIRSPEVFLCYRKGRDKPPLTDLGVLYDGKERVLPGCEVITSTPYGRCANINNSTSSKIFITFRRAPENAASDNLVVTDICVIVTSKGEAPPHSYCLINRNLNKGTVVGSNVYLCYKKSTSKDCTIAYKPGMLDRYPRTDYDGFPLPSLLPMFAMPMGAVLESWPEKAEHPKPVFSSFVLTGADGEKVYGAAVTFYEPYPREYLKPQQAAVLGLLSKSRKQKTVHVNKAICIVSRWPFFEAFRKFLFFLRTLVCKPSKAPVPIERYIDHFMFEVPFPNHHRPRIMVQLGGEYLLLTQPDDSPIPLSGASFVTMLRNVGAEKCMNLLTYVLMEHKVVVHSLRPAVLTVVIEAIGSMIFPFRWQCPYIPLCPLELSGVLSAPTPFIVGIDSQYFDVCEPPPDVTCVDLDTGTVLQPDDKKSIDHRLLPKRPAKVLKATLEAVTQQMLEVPASAAGVSDSTGIDFKQKQREICMENAVQEAFLRFMAAILKGYRSYLLPITSAPDLAATSAHMLFDMKGFLKSRDSTYHKFFAQLLNTQLFIRFIEERSFNSKREVSLAFFDECTEKVDENVDTPRLLEADSKGEHTVFVTPPDVGPGGNASPTKEAYPGLSSPTSREAAGSLSGGRSPKSGFPRSLPGTGCFPVLNHDLLRSAGGPVLKDAMPLDGFVAQRTKAEVKLAQKVAVDCKNSYSALQWAKCLLSTAYSVWFMQLAALSELSPTSPRDALRAALAVLRAMHDQRLYAPDEVCYRVVMLLCGSYQQPVLAVQALFEMRQHGLSPNAVTYGIYNKAVLESRWPSTQSTARVMWRRVRLALDGVVRFRQTLTARKASVLSRSERSLTAAESTPSLVSIASDTADGDAQSRDSVDSEDLLSVSSSNLSTRQYTSSHAGLSGDGGASDDARAAQEPELRSTESDVGYNSTSAADDSVTTITYDLDQKAKPRSLGCSPSSSRRPAVVGSPSHLSCDKSTDDQCSGSERALSTNKKPVAAKPEQPKAVPVTIDDPLGLFLLPPADISDRSLRPTATMGGAKAPMQTHTMDIRGLFGRAASVDAADVGARRSVASLLSPATSSGDVGRVADVSSAGTTGSRTVLHSLPSGDADDDTSYDGCDRHAVGGGGYVKKSDSLDSRVSTVSSSSSSAGSSTTQSDHGVAGSTERLAASAAVVKGLASKMFKSLLPRGHAAGGDTLNSSRESLPSTAAAPFPDGTDGLQQPVGAVAAAASANQSAGAPRRPPPPRALSVVSALKRSGSIGNRLASVTSVVTNKIHDKYNSLVQTVMEIQAPSTVVPSARLPQPPQQADVNSCRTSGDSAGQLLGIAAGTAPLPPDGASSIGSDQLSLLSDHRNDSIADSMDEYFAAAEDREVADQSAAHSNAGLLSPTFTEQYTPRSSGAESTAGSCSGNSTHGVGGHVAHCACGMGATEDAEPGGPITEVEMCSCNECASCGSLLYDEEIMAGWSADDSNLNTTCPFCTNKVVPFLNVVIKDLRMPSCSRCSTLDGRRPPEGCNGHTASSSRPNGTAESSAVEVAAVAAADISAAEGDTKRPAKPCSPTSPTDACQISSSPPRHRGRVVARSSVPYLSPLVLRKELENVLDVEGDRCLYSSEFVDQHPIIYWNMVWLFRRLNLVSHMPGFVLTAKECGVNLQPQEMRKPVDGRRSPAGRDDADGLGSCGVAAAPIAAASGVLPRSDASSVLVRTIWDSWCQQTEGRLGRPMYATWAVSRRRTDTRELCLPVQTDLHADISEEDFAKVIMQQIIRGIESNDMHAPILLLLEHRQAQLDAVAASGSSSSSSSSGGGMPPAPAGRADSDVVSEGSSGTGSVKSGKARFRSIYREMLFLGFIHFGKDFLEHDAFDREYKHAFRQLAVEQRALLHRSDYPPSPAVMWCRKLFGQLEVT